MRFGYSKQTLQMCRDFTEQRGGKPSRMYRDEHGNVLHTPLESWVFLEFPKGTETIYVPMPKPGEEAFDWSVIYNFPKQPPKPCDGVDGLTRSFAGLTLNQPAAVRRQLPAATYAAAVRGQTPAATYAAAVRGQTPAATQQRKTYAAVVRTPMPR